MGWYTKDTCIEIHKLIISTITCYMNALRIFKRLRRERVAYADQLWRAAYLLWRVSDSRILRHHLKLLNFSKELSYPFRGLDQQLKQDLNELFGHISRNGQVKEVSGNPDNDEDNENQGDVNNDDKNIFANDNENVFANDEDDIKENMNDDDDDDDDEGGNTDNEGGNTDNEDND